MSQTTPTPTYAGYQEFLGSYERHQWTGGLPVVPPTPALVERFLAHLGLPPGDVVARAVGVELTAEELVEHSILAGCAPESLSLVIAAMRSHLARVKPGIEKTPGWAETALALIVNGPVRRELGIASEQACMGPGWASNASIGRALNFATRAVYQRIGVVGVPAFSSPDTYSFCFGEDEENSPWEPMHVERGFPLESSTATVQSVLASLPSLDASSRTPEGVLDTLAKCMDRRASLGGRWPGHTLNTTFVVCKEVQRVFEEARWSKARFRDYLWDKIKQRKGPGAENLGDPKDSLIVAAGGAGMQWIWVLVSNDLAPVTIMVEPSGMAEPTGGTR